MDKGIYAAASGGLVGGRQIQVIGHNLANVNTVGFKAERIIRRVQEFSDSLVGAMNNVPSRAKENFSQTPGVIDVGTMTDFSQGPVEYTGNPLHAALTKENQFFSVQTESGEMLTKAGNFMRDAEGRLTTTDGKPILGDGGPIVLPPGEGRIGGNGSVTVDGQVVGSLKIVEVSDLTRLERRDGARFVAPNGVAKDAEDAQVVPESVEMPNVSVVNAMVELINAQRSFEAYTKSAQTIDQLNDSAIRNANSTA